MPLAQQEPGAITTLTTKEQLGSTHGRTRTCDPFFRKEELYPLSYMGDKRAAPTLHPHREQGRLKTTRLSPVRRAKSDHSVTQLSDLRVTQCLDTLKRGLGLSNSHIGLLD